MVIDEKADFGGGAFALLGVLEHLEAMAYKQAIEGVMHPGMLRGGGVVIPGVSVAY